MADSSAEPAPDPGNAPRPTAPPSDGPAPTGPAPTAPAHDGAAPARALREGAALEGAAPHGAAHDDAAHDDAALDGTAPTGVALNEAAHDGVAPNKAAHDGVAPNKAAHDGVAPNKAASGGAAPNRAASGGATPGGPGSAPVEPADATRALVLTLAGVSKAFGSVRALRDVSLELHAGEAHALAGENGAGKSTLIKILAGVYRPDAGRVLLDGVPVAFAGPADARDAGVAVIYQEPTLFPDLSVAENIFMGRQPRGSWRRLRRIDRAALNERARALFARLGVTLDVTGPARGLSIADQQMVEIAKALSLNARVLIMDEPTAALTISEVSRLFGVATALRREGAAVLFISHRLEEVFELCQRVTTLRDGQLVASEPVAALTPDLLVRRMVGRDLDTLYPKTEASIGEVALRVERLTREGVFRDVSFEVRRGEIVGLAGLIGAGRTEVARAVFGIDRWDAGRVEVLGRALPPASPTAAMAAGVALVPEDRRAQGLVMDMSIERNLGLTQLRRLRHAGLMSRRRERDRAADWALRLRVKHARLADAVTMLSGGNQQKVVLAKWLATEPTVLIVDEPTRGIDVGTKAEVHRLLSELAGRGMAVLMISSELPEVLGMADRVLVMREGRLVAEVPRAGATEESILAAATGQAVAA